MVCFYVMKTRIRDLDLAKCVWVHCVAWCGVMWGGEGERLELEKVIVGLPASAGKRESTGFSYLV